MPKCITCNEVYADQLRRCPHCGYAPETESVADGRRSAGGRRRSTSPGARRRTIRFAIAAVVLGAVALGGVVAWPSPSAQEDDLLTGPGPILSTRTFDPASLPAPDEITPGQVTDGLQIVSAKVEYDEIIVAGTCSPDAVARIFVDNRRAVIGPEGDRFTVRVPLGNGTIELVAEGVNGDRTTLSRQIKVDEEQPAQLERVRLLSHADGATVHSSPVRVTVGPATGSGPARAEEIDLKYVENRLEMPGGTFTLYRAPDGLRFLRVTPEGTYTFLREADDKEMVLIPTGVFRRGMGDEVPHGPAHFVKLDAYLIDRTEVTCAQYSRFLLYMDRVHDFSKLHTEDPGVPLRPLGWDGPRPPAGMEDRPVTGIAWYAAFAYARWVGCRLPTETEWERAAAGPTARPYPWGDAFAAARCRAQAVSPVAAVSIPEGVSDFGLLHTAGNVREWCLDRYDPRWYLRGSRTNPRGPARNQHRVVRGGGFLSEPDALRVQVRDQYDPSKKSGDLGFRVARNWVSLVESAD